MKKILLIIYMFLLSITCIKAYENEYFSLELDSNYKEELIEDKKYKFGFEDNYLLITIDNNTDKYIIKYFEQPDIDSYKEYILNTYKEKTNSIVSVVNIDIKNKDSLYYIEYDLLIESKNTIGHNIYQKGRTYTTDNYIYNVLLSSNNEINDTNMIDSIVIKDSYLKKINVVPYSIFSIIALGLILLFDYLLYKKKHK